MTDESANPTFYDADSAAYDAQRWVSPAGTFTNRVQQSIVAKLCADWTGGNILEAGPGTARFSVPLCQKQNRMTLLDISAQMLEVARQKIEAAGVGASIDDYVQGSIYELPFDDAQFDHAISLNVFNHLKQPGDALRELARVIRPGSTLLFNYANLQSWYWPAARRINRRSTAVGQEVFSVWERPASVRRHIADAGLDLVASRGHVHMPRELERKLGAALPIVRLLDAVSRRAPLRRLAAVQFCLCRKRG